MLSAGTCSESASCLRFHQTKRTHVCDHKVRRSTHGTPRLQYVRQNGIQRLGLACTAVMPADTTVSKLEAQLSRKWPDWMQNACRRLSQGSAGHAVGGPTPVEAAAILREVASKVQSLRLDAYARQSLARGREVKGLMEALQVTPPRTTYANPPNLTSSPAQGYPSVASMESLTARDASQAVWAAAVLGGAAMYEAETHGLIQVGQAHGWQHLTADEVANACWGLATARHCTPALGQMINAGLHPAAPRTGLLPECIAQMKGRQVTALLWGCAVLYHQPPAVLTILDSVMQYNSEAGLAKLTVRQLATCAWALSILQQQSHHLFDILINELLHRPKADFSKATLMQLHQVMLESCACGSSLESHDKQGLFKAARLVWAKEVSSKCSKQGSYYARDIVNVVIGLGLQYIEEDSTTGYAIDVSLPALRIAIEADGPSHRSRNTGQLLGHTIMKQRHVQFTGWRLLTICHTDWDDLHGRQQKFAYMQSCLDTLKC